MKLINPNDQPANIFVVMLGSLGANMLLWFALGQGSNQPGPVIAPPELIFDRVVVEKQVKNEKIVFHPIVPKPTPKPPPPKEEVKRLMPKSPPPEGAHSRIVTSKAPPAPSPDSHFVVPSGGNAPLGKPIDAQNPGNNVASPPPPPPPPPVNPPSPGPSKSPTNTQPAPPPVVVPKHEDAPPPPPTPPKAKGETREAKADHQEAVEIPESLKSQSFKSFVRVKVTITADGKFTVVLRTSSGNADVDKLVLDTLNKWTWKPALKDGETVDSVQQFRVNFSIE